MLYTLIIKSEDGTSSDYCTINSDEYKAITHICVNGVPRCKDCIHHHMTRDDRCDNLRADTDDDFFCGYFEPIEEEDNNMTTAEYEDKLRSECALGNNCRGICVFCKNPR